MKFGTSLRSPIATEKYHPGPEKYDGVESIKIKEPSRQSAIFLSPEYSFIKISESKLGPGSYTPLIDKEKMKIEYTKEFERLRRTYNSSKEKKIKVPPSIPHTNDLYVEEKVIRMEKPGPGNYNPSLNTTKNRTKLGIIDKKAREVSKPIEKEPEKLTYYNEADLLRELLASELKDIPEVSYFFKSKSSKAKEIFEPWTHNGTPPIGYYDIPSEFGKYKDTTTEQMGMAPPRFKYKSVENSPGPGFYNPGNETTKKCSKFSKGNRVRKVSNNEIPGPGYYTVNPTEKYFSKGNAVRNPVFGSSCKRFSSSKNEPTPGPTTYNVSVKRYKKPKRISLVEDFDNNFDVGENSTELTIKEENSKMSLAIGSRNQQEPKTEFQFFPPKSKVASTSSFASKVQRYNQVNVESLGPGNYNLANSMQKISFNKLGKYLPESNRGGFEGEISPNDLLGPGVYNPNYDIIHPKKHSSLKFN